MKKAILTLVAFTAVLFTLLLINLADEKEITKCDCPACKIEKNLNDQDELIWINPE